MIECKIPLIAYLVNSIQVYDVSLCNAYQLSITFDNRINLQNCIPDWKEQTIEKPFKDFDIYTKHLYQADKMCLYKSIVIIELLQYSLKWQCI